MFSSFPSGKERAIQQQKQKIFRGGGCDLTTLYPPGLFLHEVQKQQCFSTKKLSLKELGRLGQMKLE